jgi:hypothetical protein
LRLMRSWCIFWTNGPVLDVSTHSIGDLWVTTTTDLSVHISIAFLKIIGFIKAHAHNNVTASRFMAFFTESRFHGRSGYCARICMWFIPILRSASILDKSSSVNM